MGAHGWVAGIASHEGVLLSRGWLITLEAPGHPGHPPFALVDVVVNFGNPDTVSNLDWLRFLVVLIRITITYSVSAEDVL